MGVPLGDTAKECRMDMIFILLFVARVTGFASAFCSLLLAAYFASRALRAHRHGWEQVVAPSLMVSGVFSAVGAVFVWLSC